MYLPRRTSEFLEEPGTATKRQSRNPQRGTTSTGPSPANFGTAHKYNTRRPASVSCSATRKTAATPLKTPSNSARVLFTAEKRSAVANLPLHNDKKWIQDQVQRVTEYLNRSWKPGRMAGIAQDFFARPNCLRQMSIKQFVSIINFFLQFVWGSRFTVGTNYVEDIVNILQKLNYPHQVNKSWLKTPNTTHSFGNVMVLFDFLMDFAPEENCEFPLQELEEITTQSENHLKDPDIEFKAVLLQNCLESFHIWDKQMEEEYQEIKYRTADLLVQKSCGIAGLNDLDVEIERLEAAYDTLKKQRPYIAPEDMVHCERLKEYVNNTMEELNELKEKYNKDDRQIENILANQRNCLTEITDLDNKNKICEKAIKNQIFDIVKRNAYMEKTNSLKIELQSCERTMQDLTNRDHRQQIQLSVIKMKTTTQIENINKILRDLLYLFSFTDVEKRLQIPLNADCQYVERLLPSLKSLHAEAAKEIKKYEHEVRELEIDIEKCNNEIKTTLEPRLKSLEKALKENSKACQEYNEKIAEAYIEANTKLQNLEVQISQLKTEIDILRKLFDEKKQELSQIERENEENLALFEEKHQRYAATKKEFLEKFEAHLDMAVLHLKDAETFVERNKGS